LSTPEETARPASARDSLLIAHTVELLGGGVPSAHPQCPGAVFRLQPDYNLGAPDPQADVVAKLLQGGSRPHGRWADNRTVTLPVVILGPDRATIVAGRELLAQICDQQRYEVLWLRAGARGPMVLDAYRAAQPVPAYSVIEERQDFCRVQLTFTAAPYGRSEFRESLWFPSPAVGGPPPPIYRPWEAIDDYTVVHSRDQDEAWDRAVVPGSANGNPWPYSAHWSPARGRETPVYHRVLTHGTSPAVATASAPDPDIDAVTRISRGGRVRLIAPAVPPPVPAPQPSRPLGPQAARRPGAGPYAEGIVSPAPGAVDLAGRQHLNLWVGLGNSLGQWRSGNLTFSFILYDEDRNTLRFGGTFYLWASDNAAQPNFTRISVPMPPAGSFGYLTEYRIECPSFNRSSRMGDFYLHLLGAAPAAEDWHSPTVRGTVYVLRSHGTARTPMSIRVQTPPGDPADPVNPGYSRTDVFSIAGIYAYTAPADPYWAPDGTPNAMQVRVHGAGGAGGSRINATGATGDNAPAGGGAGAGLAGDDHYPLAPGESLSPVVGVGGRSNPYDLAQLPPGGTSRFGTLVATGGTTARTNDYLNVPGGQGLAPAPIRYSGGWSGYGVSAGQDGQGGGGGGGGAGSAGPGGYGGVNGSGRGQPAGRGGPGGGGGGGGGQSPYVPGGGVQGWQPGGGGGGATLLRNYSPAWGAYGADGLITASYITSQAKMRTILVHMPNPDSDATFVPVISVGDGQTNPDPDNPGAPDYPGYPSGGTQTYYPVSPHPGMPVKYSGTYQVMLAVYSWGNAAAPVIVTAEIRINGPVGPVGSVRATATLIPTLNEAAMTGYVSLGTVTLPPRWMPPDNQTMSYDVLMYSTNTADRYLDLILLDVTGSTVCCLAPGNYQSAGYSNWFIDEPESGQSMGALLGSDFGRTAAVSATDAILPHGFISGGPFMLEPGTENLFLAYSFDRRDRNNPSQGYTGSPSLAADYYPRWWFDRADDRYDPPTAGAETIIPGRPYQRPAIPPSVRALPPGA
jgi:hypothetical protein